MRVTILRAAFDELYASSRTWLSTAGLEPAAAMANDPRGGERFTIRPALDRSNSGRAALVTVTAPKTLVSKTRRMGSVVTSVGADHPSSPTIPALFTRTLSLRYSAAIAC